MESESLSDIPGDILVDIFRFMNRKVISNISLANRRWRDISRTHFAQYPLLSFMELSTAVIQEELGFEIQGPYTWYWHRDDAKFYVPLNSPLLSNPPPPYLRFEEVDILAIHLFEKYPKDLDLNVRKLLDILKRLQSAFVDSEMFFNSGPRLGEPFTTRRSLLQFLEVDILPLFPNCRECRLSGLNMEGLEENEVEREPLLLLPQLYNSESRIELGFSFRRYLGFDEWETNTFAMPMISIQEVITWLHRPNPQDPSKMRELYLGKDIFSYDDALRAIAIKEIKRRLLEIFVSATQRCSYVLEVILFGTGHSHISPELKEDCIALNDKTGEQLKIYIDQTSQFRHFAIFKRTHRSDSS